MKDFRKPKWLYLYDCGKCTHMIADDEDGDMCSIIETVGTKIIKTDSDRRSVSCSCYDPIKKENKQK